MKHDGNISVISCARAPTLSDLLRSPLVAQRPQLVRVHGAHLVQSGQVPGQVRPKVLGGFGQVGDVLTNIPQGWLFFFYYLFLIGHR